MALLVSPSIVLEAVILISDEIHEYREFRTIVIVSWESPKQCDLGKEIRHLKAKVPALRRPSLARNTT